MNNTIKTIDLNNYKSTWGDLNEFREDLFNLLGDKLYQYISLEEIVFHTLKIIYPTLNKDKVEIENKAGEILEHFRMKKFLNTETKKLFVQRYIEEVIQLKQPPKNDFENLQAKADKHLNFINEKVKFYSNQKSIKEFKEKGSTPSNHEERTILDFYFRCIDEQQLVIGFIYTDEMKKRALAKSTYSIISTLPLFTSELFDFPYQSAVPWNRNYFDHTRINAQHRVASLSIDTSIDMENLYYSNKESFYQKYFEEQSKEGIINSIIYYLSNLPLSKDRKLIVNELILLFREKRWIAFYGLALSQIEGLFSEMLELLPNKTKQTNSLSRKVSALRPFHDLSTSYFDYFEYYIPRLRNKFMHGSLDGSEKDPLNSYDLLLDLQFLLEAIESLDSPYIALTKIINRPDIPVSTFNEVAILFDLYSKLNPSQKKKIEGNFKSFFKDHLVDTTNLNYILYEEKEKIEKNIKYVISKLKHSQVIKLDFQSLSYNQIKSQLGDSNKLKEIFEFDNEELQSIIYYDSFLKNYKKSIYSFSNELKTITELIFIEHKENISKLNTTARLVISN